MRPGQKGVLCSLSCPSLPPALPDTSGAHWLCRLSFSFRASANSLLAHFGGSWGIPAGARKLALQILQAGVRELACYQEGPGLCPVSTPPSGPAFLHPWGRMSAEVLSGSEMLGPTHSTKSHSGAALCWTQGSECVTCPP